jgi:hypothetical protein
MTGGSPTPSSMHGQPVPTIDPNRTNSASFYAYDHTDHRFFISAYLDRNDNLLFTIIRKILGATDKSLIPAEMFFDVMMIHFQNCAGGLPLAIRAIWDNSDPQLVTNLQRFNDAIKAGADPETAAWKTFTGKMAKKWGFTNLVPGISEPPGATHDFTKVVYYFKR